jgi:hypothetical protein
MTEPSTTPPRPTSRQTMDAERGPLLRTRSVKALLPMNDESVFSTRGQNLPLLISHLSSSVNSKVQLNRRGSFFVGPDDKDLEANEPLARRSAEFERIKPGAAMSRPSLLSAATTDGNTWSTGMNTGDLRTEPRTPEERRMSDAAIALLNAPHLRSMRLIGKSNHRYKWYESLQVLQDCY